MIAKVIKNIESAEFMDGDRIAVKAGQKFEVCGVIYHDKNIYVHTGGRHLILPRNKVKIFKNTKRSLTR